MFQKLLRHLRDLEYHYRGYLTIFAEGEVIIGDIRRDEVEVNIPR
jgi:hypothetical protein